MSMYLIDNLKNNILPISTDPVLSIIVIFLIVITFIYLIIGSNSSNPLSITNIFLLLAIIISVFYFIFGVNIVAIISNYFFNTNYNIYSNNLEPPITEVPDIVVDISNNTYDFDKKEVFNIPENRFTYPEARSLCNAYGAELATYKNIEDAYNKGAEWCNYGWSDNGLALFPTQQHTYDNLQKTKKYKNACGRPGINGGYISNQNIKFGVNCYGIKPDKSNISDDPQFPTTEWMMRQETQKDLLKKPNNISISPFNNTEWNSPYMDSVTIDIN